MSTWISWARGKVGMADGGDEGYEMDQDSYDMRELESKRSALLRTQKLQLAQLEDEYEEIQEELQVAVKKKDQNTALKHLTRKQELEDDIATLQGKIENQEYLQKAVSDAHQNRDQVQLMQAGAKEMETIVKQTERIDIDGVVDRYEDASRITNTHSQRLAKPIKRGGATGRMRRQNDVKDELDRLMQEDADRNTAELDSMPSVPTTTIVEDDEELSSKISIK